MKKGIHIEKKQSLLLKSGLAALFLVLFFGAVYGLNKPVEGEAATSASQLIFVTGHVTRIVSENTSPDTWTEGRNLGTQDVYIRLDSGAFRGEELPAVNYLNAYSNIDLREGTRIIVRLDYDDLGKPYIASIANYNRGIVLLGLSLVFVLLIIVLGGKKGVATVISLAFTVICIWFILIPLLMRGAPTILFAVLLVAVTTAVSLLLLNGLSTKTLCATLGCIGGVAFAGISAAISGALTPLNGFNMDEAEELILRSGSGGMKISGLLVSGILISALGAVMDVAMSITSAVHELHDMNPEASRKKLFQSGINIGRDTMGTMANTLILAFAGASLNMLILFRVFDYPTLQIFNSDMMAIEVIQGLSGSIGIVLTVPLVAALSAFLYGKKQK